MVKLDSEYEDVVVKGGSESPPKSKEVGRFSKLKRVKIFGYQKPNGLEPYYKVKMRLEESSRESKEVRPNLLGVSHVVSIF